MILKSYEAAIERSCTKVLFSKYRKEACSLIGNEHLQGYFSRILTKSLFHLHCETAIFITPNFEGHLSPVASDTFEHAISFKFILCEAAAAACFTLSAPKKVFFY